MDDRSLELTDEEDARFEKATGCPSMDDRLLELSAEEDARSWLVKNDDNDLARFPRKSQKTKDQHIDNVRRSCLPHSFHVRAQGSCTSDATI